MPCPFLPRRLQGCSLPSLSLFPCPFPLPPSLVRKPCACHYARELLPVFLSSGEGDSLMPFTSKWKALELPLGRDEGWVVPETVVSVIIRQFLFLSSFPDAPSRAPTSFSSDGAPSYESETTSHSPHATWHTAPNASTNGGTTTTYTGNCAFHRGL